MLRASLLLSTLVLVSGLTATGIAMADSSGAGKSATTHVGVTLPNQVCASGPMPDPQDCYPPNRQGKRGLEHHAG
ncbi:MAG TPA: hypothetical protein VHA10_07760 [Hypericibacter adhaerens]|jgi:hypothetical protein|uniref:Uncharacterized protein n=1 Tax=Hypericibacter adhaerens TaxID=2602016 RepID=A0A5J6N2C5_9PROT|nr:hypothetical protein [Hypericibacter adhaerens]QEX23881.1 hypothetical protein FRZ61_38200 [Hypericibacter adhaerens]HWA43090.1 hypothetical protein [Hypericibacter adhaerens]